MDRDYFTDPQRYMSEVMEIIDGYDGKYGEWVPRSYIERQWKGRGLPVDCMELAIHSLISYNLPCGRLFERNTPVPAYTQSPDFLIYIKLPADNIARAVKGATWEMSVQLYEEFEPFHVDGMAFPLLPSEFAAEFFRRHEDIKRDGWRLVRNDTIYDKSSRVHTAGVAGNHRQKGSREAGQSIKVFNKGMNSGCFIEVPLENLSGNDNWAENNETGYGHLRGLVHNSWIRLNKRIINAVYEAVALAGEKQAAESLIPLVHSYAEMPQNEGIERIVKGSRSDEEIGDRLLELNRKHPFFERSEILEPSGIDDIFHEEINIPQAYRGVYFGTKAGEAQRAKRAWLAQYAAETMKRITEGEYLVTL